MKKQFVVTLYVLTALPFLKAAYTGKTPSYNPGEWNNDVPGFVRGKFYVTGGIGALNLNFTVANALKNSIAPNWDKLTLDKKTTWFAKAEYAVSPHWGVGINFATGGLGVNVSMDSVIMGQPISGTLTYRSWSALARVNYHIIAENNWDVYVGAGAGYRANNISVKDNDPITDRWNFPVDLGFITKRIPNTLHVPTFGADFTLGVRYHILPPVALYMEAGLAKSAVQGGMVVRF